MANGNGKNAWQILGVVAAYATLLAGIIGSWLSLSKDVAVVKSRVDFVRDDIARHEREIEKLRDARRAEVQPEAAEPAA